MNNIALSKIKECLSLASEFVKDENTYYASGGYISSEASFGASSQVVKKRSVDIRTKAEQEASKLEKQEKCANLIKECLKYLETVENFENTVIACGCQNK